MVEIFLYLLKATGATTPEWRTLRALTGRLGSPRMNGVGGGRREAFRGNAFNLPFSRPHAVFIEMRFLLAPRPRPS